ncbi:MAG TPA: fibronectin type III domain-containing protein [Nitrospiraceae bacterium]|nr:fibronectin type III domain-containing protein [Nitrospiraceae bacterium]
MACPLLLLNRALLLAGITHEVDRTQINSTTPTSLEQHMRDLAKQQPVLLQTRVTEHARKPLRLPVIVTGILLSIMPLLTGCGGGEADSQPSITTAPGSAGVTASLEWSPVQDHSVSTYFVHYGRQSPGQEGSCAYESSLPVESPSATITNLDPNTRYYFTVSAYNGLESACADEISTVTPPASV